MLYHWATTAGRPPTLTILYAYCTGGTECLSHTPSWQPLSMCRQNSVRGRPENSLHQEARGVLGSTLSGYRPFHFPLFSPHNIYFQCESRCSEYSSMLSLPQSAIIVSVAWSPPCLAILNCTICMTVCISLWSIFWSLRSSVMWECTPPGVVLGLGIRLTGQLAWCACEVKIACQTDTETESCMLLLSTGWVVCLLIIVYCTASDEKLRSLGRSVVNSGGVPGFCYYQRTCVASK